jgi:hypothetical protein
MKEISRSEAQEALNALNDGFTKFSIQGGPDRLCNITVYPVQVWDGDSVDWKDVMFIRENGRVKLYASVN